MVSPSFLLLFLAMCCITGDSPWRIEIPGDGSTEPFWRRGLCNGAEAARASSEVWPQRHVACIPIIPQPEPSRAMRYKMHNADVLVREDCCVCACLMLACLDANIGPQWSPWGHHSRWFHRRHWRKSKVLQMHLSLFQYGFGPRCLHGHGIYSATVLHLAVPKNNGKWAFLCLQRYLRVQQAAWMRILELHLHLVPLWRQDMNHDTIWYNMIQYDTIWYNMIQYDTIWYNMTQYDTIWYNMTIPCNSMHAILTRSV